MAVTVNCNGVMLPGILTFPSQPKGLVIFAHGSGSSRLSPRNQFVADHLVNAGFGTLLFDLLTEHEGAHRQNVFDIRLLAERLREAAMWVAHHPGAHGLPLGFFGASTGSAAALVAAATMRGLVPQAVVSRGGRPDLAFAHLKDIRTPTLLIVGSNDPVILDLNVRALAELAGPKELSIVNGATHLFEEKGALEEVAVMATDWFERYLTPAEAGVAARAT